MKLLRAQSMAAGWPAWWRLAESDRRWVLGAAALGAAILLSAAAFLLWQGAAGAELRQEQDAYRSKQDRMQQRAAAEARAAASAAAPWWSQIPADKVDQRSAAEQLSADALAIAPPLNVQVLRMSMAPMAMAEAAPYRGITVRVELRGTYPDVKRWLSELLARRPHSLGLRSLDLRRGAEGAAAQGIEASVELRLFEQASDRAKGASLP